MKLTTAQRRLLTNARDFGGAYRYRAPQVGGCSLPARASTSAAIARLRVAGLLDTRDQITTAGLAALNQPTQRGRKAPGANTMATYIVGVLFFFALCSIASQIVEAISIARSNNPKVKAKRIARVIAQDRLQRGLK
jgi:hypothetical protein